MDWYYLVCNVDTGESAPPFARAFNYLKYAKGEWVCQFGERIYPWQAIRNAPNPAFQTSPLFRANDWEKNLSLLLTCADQDQTSRAAIGIVVLLRGKVTADNNLAYLRDKLITFLTPRPARAEDRDIAGLEIDSVLYRTECKENEAKMNSDAYKWLTNYYSYERDKTTREGVFSFFEPLTGDRLRRLQDRIDFWTRAANLPSIESSPAPLPEPITFWNPRNPCCSRCQHDARNCSTRCKYCNHDGKACKERNNPQRRRPRQNRPPPYTIGHNADVEITQSARVRILGRPHGNRGSKSNKHKRQ